MFNPKDLNVNRVASSILDKSCSTSVENGTITVPATKSEILIIIVLNRRLKFSFDTTKNDA